MIVTRLIVSLLIAIVAVSDAAAQLTASWVDNSNGQAAFLLDRRTGDDPTFWILADVPAGQAAYVDSNVVEGVTYCYRVKAHTTSTAWSGSNESGYSNEACGSVSVVPSFTVIVTKAGAGGGTVSSSVGGVVCGSSCSATYPAGTLVTLNATPVSGSRFAGWGGGCSGTGACTVTGNVAVVVTAVFVQSWIK